MLHGGQCLPRGSLRNLGAATLRSVMNSRRRISAPKLRASIVSAHMGRPLDGPSSCIGTDRASMPQAAMHCGGAKQWGLAARRVSDVKSTYRARRLAHESADAACDARSTGHDCAVQCISRFVPCGLPTILLGQTSEEYAAMGQKPATGCSCIHLWTVSPQREAMGIGCPTSF